MKIRDHRPSGSHRRSKHLIPQRYQNVLIYDMSRSFQSKSRAAGNTEKHARHDAPADEPLVDDFTTSRLHDFTTSRL